MEIRVLKYFLTVAREQNITRAAEALHMTQPTLSRQLASLEQELGVTLFTRNSRKIILTEEGILLKRRALEIIELEEKTVDELKKHDELVEGVISIGCGELEAVESLAEICKNFHKKYPKVQINLHTETADVVSDMMNQGLLDIGLFMNPFNTESFDYVRLPQKEFWIVAMRSDDPLAQKEFITKSDLIDKPLILPKRVNVQGEIANWFGRDFNKLNIVFTSNLSTNAAIMVRHKIAYLITVKGAKKLWDSDLIVYRKLSPELVSESVLAWRRNIPHSTPVQKFIDEINAFQAL